MKKLVLSIAVTCVLTWPTVAVVTNPGHVAPKAGLPLCCRAR